ncbi:MAG: glucose-1-phosphate thymidylyltransferase [Rhodospirillaceae bacterium]|nr:glucose-1-phosphate thymidylyltransferase [Rhodospirillaceae bacterium]
MGPISLSKTNNTVSCEDKYCGLVLAAGMSSRMYPTGRVISKQLMTVYDKPLVYYPIAVLMEAGIRDIFIIVATEALNLFVKLLGDGSQWGVRFNFIVQPEPQGIAQAFHLCKEKIQGKSVFLILGDNVIFGTNFQWVVKNALNHNSNATIFSYPVEDPSRYGVVELGTEGEPISLVEKPQHTNSHLAVPGLYLYDDQVVDLASKLTPSHRGEYEITDVNKEYMAKGALSVVQLDKSVSWFDAGTYDSILEASLAIRTQQNHKTFVGYPEYIAFINGYINYSQFNTLIRQFPKCFYRSNLEYLQQKWVKEKMQ